MSTISTWQGHHAVKRGLLASAIACALLLLMTIPALASSVNIYDNASVLNSSQIRSAASSLSYPLSVYTTNSNLGSSQFDQAARNKINGSDSIVLAVNVSGRHVYVTGGSKVPLTSSQYTQVANDWANDYRSNSDYTRATMTAVNSLKGMLNSSNNGNGGVFDNPVTKGGLNSSACCCIGLLVLLGLIAFAIIRQRKGGTGGGFGGFGNFGGFRRQAPPPPYDPNYNQYNQPYGNNYPPNYGPGNRGGMNPWAAGGLGAAAGGLAGYELGKQQGENENRGDRGDFGGGNDFGGGGGADFGGGNDFGGGGGADFGGGNDFGGGGGSDNGGGSNF
ncbi:hypothetical protein [Tengunoibacter tsumagoiensis]|uniref:TPM domain-containing protein n=1 Tax=Tengunoibacter tsumagoiensis TaxID=2014871 RepID=A0A402A5I8_9CHLR|nr:hypothetical protein [Tengunoibacter tsumagoiensis]GCE14316.1 hypothetical protein KTT_41750 [Tengunoibacter tsumagoiensis]